MSSDGIDGDRHGGNGGDRDDGEGGGSGDDGLYERALLQSLPPEISKSVMTFLCDSSAGNGVCDVYVVGTTPESKESCEEVRALIDFLKPDAVFLELCARRLSVLHPRPRRSPRDWEFQVVHGKEFRAAYEEATKCDADVVFIDRPMLITFRRAWAKMSHWRITKLMFSFVRLAFSTEPKPMNDADMTPLMTREMSKQLPLPTFTEIFLHERDQFMSAKILSSACQYKRVVAVVGRDHLPGIKNNWKQHVDVDQLLTEPSREMTKIQIGTTLAGIAMIAGIYFFRS